MVIDSDKRIEKSEKILNYESPLKDSNLLEFGQLIEQQIGSFDLKKEMEKLRAQDEQQKLQQRIQLKFSPQNTLLNLSSNMDADEDSPVRPISQRFNSDSPAKRILLGEFDDT